MPAIPIVVEGPTDVAFFRKLASLVPLLPGTSLEPRTPGENRGGRNNIPGAVEALVTAGVERLILAEDFNGKTPDQIIQSHRDTVSRHLGHSATDLSDTGDMFRVQNVTVVVIPMGLYDDPDLNALGITSHSMEDYLIKLLLLDESLRPAGPRFRQLIEGLIQTIRNYGVTFDSSKEMFQLVKPVIKHGFSDTGVVEALFEKASPEHLQTVMDPLIDRLERAAAL